VINFRQAENIIVTAQGLIGNTLTVDAVNYPVFPGWSFADPEKMREQNVTPPDAFAVIEWPSMLAGNGGAHQMDVYVLSRIGAIGAATSDPFGQRARKMLELVQDAISPNRSECAFEVLDYAGAVDRTDPDPTGMWAVVKSSRGLSHPEVIERFDLDGTHIGYRVVYLIYLSQDLSQGWYHDPA